MDLYRFSTVDLMGIHHNVTFRSLTEDLRQLYHRKAAAVDNISQHISRSHTGELVFIPYQDQSWFPL